MLVRVLSYLLSCIYRAGRDESLEQLPPLSLSVVSGFFVDIVRVSICCPCSLRGDCSSFSAQSRFLGNSILPYEDEPELAARLKREKEKKAEERMRQLQSQNTLDRVLGSIGKVRFW